MTNMIVFHSGSPSWNTCRLAIGIANKMKEKLGNKIEVNIYKNDAEEAKAYNLLSSTNVFVNDELISREIFLDGKKMYDYLSKLM